MCDGYDFCGASNHPYPSQQKNPHLELAAWQVKEIKQALKEADAGEFSLAEDLAKAAEKAGYRLPVLAHQNQVEMKPIDKPPVLRGSLPGISTDVPSEDDRV